MLLVPTAAFLVNLAFVSRSFPVTEGWFETYAYLLQEGRRPYQDFNFSLSPFIIYIALGYQKIFGDLFVVYRLIGALIFSLNLYLTIRLVARFYSTSAASIGTFFAGFLVLTNPVFIAKDYHTYVDLLLVTTFLVSVEAFRVLVGARQSEHTKTWGWISRPSGLVLLTGLAAGLLFLTKQNVGLNVAGSMFLALEVGAWVLGIGAGPMILLGATFWGGFFMVLSAATYTLFESLNVMQLLDVLLFQNNAKGDVGKVLFRIIEGDNLLVMKKAAGVFSLGVVAVLAYRWFEVLRRYMLMAMEVVARRVELGIVIVVVGGVVVSWLLSSPLSLLGTAIGVAALIGFLVLSGGDNNAKVCWLPILFSFAALVYSNTQTASLNYVGTYFVIAFAVAFIVNESKNFVEVNLTSAERGTKRKLSVAYDAMLVILIAAVIGSALIRKVFNTYDWWGLKEGSVFSARTELAHPALSHIRVTEGAAEVFARINNFVKQESRERDDVYFYPNIPMFYLLNNKLPPYKSLVQWFDVISTAQLEEEMRLFKEKPPHAIVFLDPPEFVYRGHEDLLGRRVAQRAFREEMFQGLIEGRYRFEDQMFLVENWLKVTPAKTPTDETFPRTEEVLVLREEYVDKPLQDLLRAFGNQGREVRLRYFRRDGIQSVLDEIGYFYKNIKLRKGDVVGVEITDRIQFRVFPLIGYCATSPYHTIALFVRATGD